MKYAALISKSKAHLASHSSRLPIFYYGRLFSFGARWMQDRLNEMDEGNRSFDSSVSYNLYGWMKYSICVLAMLLSAYGLAHINLLLLPLSIVAFYLVEIQFLFLFPLLVDGCQTPIVTSIKLTYKTGYFKAITTVIPIAFFMLCGLLNRKAPFQNWYIGSLAILIWYDEEIGNRI